MKREQLNDLIDKKTGDLNLNIFGVSDGLKSSECTGTSYNSAVENQNGEFWFASKKGIAVFQPEKVEINKQAPKVFIEKITVNREFISIDPGKNSFKSIDSIRFHFTAPTFISQERVFFKIKLEGYDKEWFLVYPHERRTVEYRNLPGGGYKFRVTACNNDGVWNKEGVNFLFVVSPGFFKTTTFKLVIAAGIPLLLFLGYFVYVRFKQKEKKKQQPLTLDVKPGTTEPINPNDVEKAIEILLDFEQYIAQIGVRAFYKEKKPYEETGQFLLTAWLYQFIRGGEGYLRYEVVSGLGIMDITLTYKGRRYIIETKINRQNLSRTLDQGMTQLSEKYLASEHCPGGYLVIYDTKTPVGAGSEPQNHRVGDETVTSFIIGIDISDEEWKLYLKE